MRFIALIFIVSFISCETGIHYPDGGYNYPANIVDEDSNLYDYPLKNIHGKKALFRSYYDYLVYQPFNEQNLSLRPLANETFRLTYSTSFGETMIITFSEGLMTIKKGNPPDHYEHDTSRLTHTENYLLRLLNRRYPIDTAGKPPGVKKYLDSMTKLYPQLLDAAFYHSLFEKEFFIKKEKFNYTERKINLSKREYTLLVNEINLSGFWKLPHVLECTTSMTDGDGFTLEANTKHKWQIVTLNSCTGTEPKFRKVWEKIFDFSKN